MAHARLTSEAVDEALATMPKWQLGDDGRSLRRKFRFADFSEAFGFMTRVALAAEAADHHPDWSNSYGRVEIALTTHDAGGITALDLELARIIDRLAAG